MQTTMTDNMLEKSMLICLNQQIIQISNKSTDNQFNMPYPYPELMNTQIALIFQYLYILIPRNSTEHVSYMTFYIRLNARVTTT